MGPSTAKPSSNLDKIIEGFDPDEVDFSPSSHSDPFRQLEQLQSEIDQIQHDVEELSRMQEIGEPDDGFEKDTISAAITDYYQKRSGKRMLPEGENVQTSRRPVHGDIFKSPHFPL